MPTPNPFGFLFSRKPNQGEPKPDGEPTPAAQPPQAAEPAPTEAPGAPVAVPDEARELAQALLADKDMASQLPAEAREALFGLLAVAPTAAQVRVGVAALVAVAAAMAQAMGGAAGVAGLAAQALGLPDTLAAWYMTPDWPASRRWLADHLAELDDDAPELLEQAAARAGGQSDGKLAATLLRHAVLLREARRLGVDPAYRAIIGAGAFVEQGATEGDDDGDDRDTLLAWLNTHPYRAQRRYLEAHPELLDPASDARLERLARQYREQAEAQLAALRPALAATPDAPLPDDLWERLLAYGEAMETVDTLIVSRRLLGDIRARGGDTQAIRSGYVNERGGLMLDLPAWLEEADRKLTEIKASGPAYATAPERVALLRSALARALKSQEVASETVAELHARLWDAIDDGIVTSVDPAAAQDEAIAELEQQALRVYTLERFPQQYAATQNNLGAAWSERIAGEKRDNLERALACYEAALRVRTLERFPQQYAATQNNLGRALADYGTWARAASAWEAVTDAQDFLLALSGSVAGKDATLREGAGAATRAAFARIRLREYAAAALDAERGRARGLAETQRLQAGDPARISDPARRARYTEARAALSQAQIALNLPVAGDELARALVARGVTPATPEEAQRQALASAIRDVEQARADVFNQAKTAFDVSVAEVRAAADPAEFLLAPLDLAALGRAAARGGARHALVYLGATPWGGMALAVFAADPSHDQPAHVAALDLPALTTDAVFDLIQRPLTPGEGRLIGGYAHAQEGNGFGLLLRDWPGETLRARMQALHAACVAAGVSSPLGAAVQRAMLSLGANPDYAHTIDASLESLPARESAVVASSVNNAFLRVELTRSRSALADAALRPLAEWLGEQGASSVTLIPCGELAAFPLVAAEVAPGVTFGERFGASISPSARSLLRDEAAHQQARRRRTAGVATVGDPRVTHQPLKWGEAEAQTVAKLARRLGLPAEARVQEKATRGWLLNRLADALLVDASCHGFFDAREPLDSFLALAGAPQPTPLTLRELVNQGIEGQGLLLGLRLLILSACQTGILDLRGATDEARSLTAAVLEAGADAAMGALWSVDDKATYLLIVRFAQLWLPHMETMPPAAALAQAQHWLRTVTNKELRAWRYDDFPEPTVEEKRAAGSAEPERDPWRDEEAAQAAYAAAIAQAEAALAQGRPPAAQPVAPGRLIAVRGPGDRLAEPDEGKAPQGGERGERQERLDPKEAQYLTREQAWRASDPNACPYAHPYYWAAFQITGW